MTETERFALAVRRTTSEGNESIGTQKEKLLHRTMKYFLEPNADCHEIPLYGYVADIFRSETGEIIEIQTAGFDKLRAKLRVFLEHHPVTVVYPIPDVRWLLWIDPDSGEVSQRRKSSRRGRATDVLPEAFWLGDMLQHPNLTVQIVFVDIEEYRLADGYGPEGKKHAHRFQMMPLEYKGAMSFKTAADYRALLEGLSVPFTRKDLSKLLRHSGMKLSRAATMLERIGAIKRVGKEGNAILYDLN